VDKDDVSAIAPVISGIGIVDIVQLAVTGRTRGIGLRTAVGARQNLKRWFEAISGR
jgi:ABC-type antimicrobial peptide transport system permease subunit